MTTAYNAFNSRKLHKGGNVNYDPFAKYITDYYNLVTIWRRNKLYNESAPILLKLITEAASVNLTLKLA